MSGMGQVAQVEYWMAENYVARMRGTGRGRASGQEG